MSPAARQALARERDRSFERLYRHHRPAVYGVLLRDLRDPDEAEDITQTTFLNAYCALHRGDSPERPRAWLLAIARNVLRRQFRLRAARPQEVALDVERVAALDDYEGPGSAEIRDALSRLRPTHRAVILLREFSGLSYAEIARELDISQSAVETLLFRARRRLREELEEAEGVDERRSRLRSLFPLPFPAGAVAWLDSLVLNLSRNGMALRAAGVLAAAALGTGVAIETGAVAGITSLAPALGEPAQTDAQTPPGAATTSAESVVASSAAQRRASARQARAAAEAGTSGIGLAALSGTETVAQAGAPVVSEPGRALPQLPGQPPLISQQPSGGSFVGGKTILGQPAPVVSGPKLPVPVPKDPVSAVTQQSPLPAVKPPAVKPPAVKPPEVEPPAVKPPPLPQPPVDKEQLPVSVPEPSLP